MMNNHGGDASLSSQKDHQLKSDVDAAHQQQNPRWIEVEMAREGEKRREKTKMMMAMIANSGEDNLNEDVVRRVCQVCRRVFKSGKALGGHMRIHVGPADENSKLDLNLISFDKRRRNPNYRRNPRSKLIDFAAGKSTTAAAAASCETSPCVVCGKIFTSKNALFGHMRSHPEREWRGIKRPSNNDSARSCSSSSSILDVAEPLQEEDRSSKCELSSYSLTGWTVKRNRGTLGFSSDLISSSKEVLDVHNSMEECARNLLILSRGLSSDDESVAGFRLNSRENKEKMDHQHAEKGSDELDNGSGLDSDKKFDTEDCRCVRETDRHRSIGEIALINGNKKRIRKRDELSGLEELQAKSCSQVKTSVNLNEVGEEETASTTCNKIHYSGEKTFHTHLKVKIAIGINPVDGTIYNDDHQRSCDDIPTSRNQTTEAKISMGSPDNAVVECGSMGGALLTIRRALDFDLNEEPTWSI